MSSLTWTEDQLAAYQRRVKGNIPGVGRTGPAQPGVPAPRVAAVPQVSIPRMLRVSPLPRMNKTEARYAQRLTDAGRSWRYEPLKIQLAERTTYTPDFLVIDPHGDFSLHEVKGGFVREDAWIKFKIAREMYPMFTFELWQWVKNNWRRIA